MAVIMIETPAGEVHCKVGTIPATVILDRRKRTLKVGDRVRIRDAHCGSRWKRARVTNLSPLRLSLYASRPVIPNTGGQDAIP